MIDLIYGVFFFLVNIILSWVQATKFHIFGLQIHHMDPFRHKMGINEGSTGQTEEKNHCVIIWGYLRKNV